MRLTSRRKVSAAAIAALAALGASALAISPASAGNAPRIAVSSTSVRAAAGTCQIVTFTPVDSFGVTSRQPDTLTVNISENPSSASQDLDFCVVPGADTPGVGTTDGQPSYVNGAVFDPTGPGVGTRQFYTPGPGITGNGTSSGGTPDSADNSTQPAPMTTGKPPAPTNGKYNSTNPSGVDSARFVYDPMKGSISMGVVGLTPGTATIQGFFDDGKTGTNAGDFVPESEETQAPPVTFTITGGGQPGSAEAAAAVSTIEVQPTTDVGAPGSAQNFTATLRNGSGDTVRGVTPQVQVAQNGANPSATPRCDESDNSGVSRCTFTGFSPGTDVLTVYVNRAGGTAGIDPGEVTKQVTRTTTKPAVAASEARYLDLTPKNQQTVSGQSATFTATITDVNGAPAQGVFVIFNATGPGQFGNSSLTTSGTSDATGRVQVRVNTSTTDNGLETIGAQIGTANTQCNLPAGAGNGANASTPAGRCSDTVTQQIAPAPSPSPSPSSTRSASPSASQSPSSSTSPRPARQQLSLRTSTPDIQPNETGIYDVTGQPNSSIELRCYTRPNTDYFTARGPVNLTSGGDTQFRILPGANTRCYVRYASDDATASGSVVINVHTTLSLSTVRTGTRNYVFQGRNLPRRSGQLITLYRVDSSGREIRTSNLTTDSSGIYRVTRQFTGTGTFQFKVRTSQTLNNAAGVSNTITVAVR